MSKPNSGLFLGTTGSIASEKSSAESIIARRTSGMDLREHPIGSKQLSSSKMRQLSQKISSRTATREEYNQYSWNKRFTKRRQAGIDNFWRQERKRLLTGKTPTRQWTSEQKAAILRNERPKISGRPFQSHHTYSASKFPHLSNRGEVIYPATFSEHLYDWHGGNYKNSLPGKPINKIDHRKRRRKR